MLTMKNPAHPAELARDNIEELGLSVAEAAKGLGVTRQQLHNVIVGKSAVSPEMAVRFEKAFGGNADMWLRMQAACDLAQARAKGGAESVTRLAARPKRDRPAA
jgi:addiction module HigA family antidote